MLIETDLIDWSKPIVWFDPIIGNVLPALLVSTNYKPSSSSSVYYCVVVYSKDGDKLEYANKDGKQSSSNSRKIYNSHAPSEKEQTLTDATAKAIKGLGDF